MQSASSRIWTRVAVSISYDDNHYTTGTSIWHNLSNLWTALMIKTERSVSIMAEITLCLKNFDFLLIGSHRSITVEELDFVS